MRAIFTITIVVALAAGSAVLVAAQSEEVAQARGACDAPLPAPGDYADTYAVGDSTAKYWVVVPETYAQDAPVPLVLWLSSGDGDADKHHVGWKPYLDGIGELFVVVGRSGAWDVEALIALVDRLEADYCVDPRRIHVMGSSSSAYATSKLVCEASERIASFFDSMGMFKPVACVPERPVPLTANTGGPDRSRVALSVRQWAEWNGCEPDPLVADIGSGVRRHTYLGCDADVELFDIEDGGHNFIFHECIGPVADLGMCRAYAEYDELEDTLAFFQQHPLPAE